MRKLLAIVIAGALLGVLASSALAVTKTVKVGDVFIKPKTLSVAKGTTIKWKWVGTLSHNVTVKSGPVKFRSPTQTSGTFSKKLRRKGTYVLYCTIHGYAAQHQKIRVG